MQIAPFYLAPIWAPNVRMGTLAAGRAREILRHWETSAGLAFTTKLKYGSFYGVSLVKRAWANARRPIFSLGASRIIVDATAAAVLLLHARYCLSTDIAHCLHLWCHRQARILKLAARPFFEIAIVAGRKNGIKTCSNAWGWRFLFLTITLDPGFLTRTSILFPLNNTSPDDIVARRLPANPLPISATMTNALFTNKSCKVAQQLWRLASLLQKSRKFSHSCCVFKVPKNTLYD